MSDKIRVIQYGLGPIGSAVARHVAERPELQLVGAVDIDPGKAGRDAGEVMGLGRALGFAVVDNLSKITAPADVVTHNTSSYFEFFKPQILEILAAGYDIVSSAEEMSFPWLADAADAAEIDAAAKRAGKTVLSTGVNPGFLMDSLPLMLTGVCQRVDRIDIARTQNASLRRGPFQAKVGSGMTVEQFMARMAEGHMGHVGLVQSTGMLFRTLGKELVRYEDKVEPVVADQPIHTPFFDVEPGKVRGLKQVARGFSPEGEFVTLTFVAALDWPEDEDTIRITGKPDLEVKLHGTNGDIATVAICVNAIRRVAAAAPGLVTMRDLPIVTR